MSIALVGVSYLKVKAKENVLYFFSPKEEEWEYVLSNIAHCDKKLFMFIGEMSLYPLEPKNKRRMQIICLQWVLI